MSGSLGALGREAKGLRGAWVLQQGPSLQAVRARWALAMQRRLAVRRSRGLASRPGQRLQRGMWGGQLLWVQGRCLLDMVGRSCWSLAGGLRG